MNPEPGALGHGGVMHHSIPEEKLDALRLGHRYNAGIQAVGRSAQWVMR